MTTSGPIYRARGSNEGQFPRVDIGQRGLGETEVEEGLDSRWTWGAGDTEAWSVCWEVRGQDLSVAGVGVPRVEEPRLTTFLMEKGEP